MVSLFDILLKKPTWAHISTGISGLDSVIRVAGSHAILDFQSTPIHNAMFAVICNMMVSQLEEDVNKTVIVIETFNQFPWQLFSQHPRYEEAWMSRIKRFYLPTFAQVLSFFMLNPLKSLANSAFVIIVNFHEVVEYYRYQIVVSFEEALLKHQIERNSVVIDNFRKDENGGNHEQSVPTLDGQSSLANESPFSKFQTHVDALFQHLNSYLVSYNLLVLIVGCMDVKYKNRPKPSINHYSDALLSESEIFPSQQQKKILHFDPIKYDKIGQAIQAGLNESRITQRVIFYNDWYHKSQHFSMAENSASHQTLRKVAAAKADKDTGTGNIIDPIYFDFNHKLYGKESIENDWLIDLLDAPDEDLSSFLEESILSTQEQLKPPYERARKRLKLAEQVPSSPVRWESHAENSLGAGNLPIQDTQALVIEGSDVELTGTIFEGS